jgi:pyruvate kinase
MRILSLSYGVWATYQPQSNSRRNYIRKALNDLINSRHITSKDLVAYLSGSEGTSFLEINSVGKFLAEAEPTITAE